VLTTVQREREKEKIGRMLVLCSVDSCGEKRLRCERSASCYYGALSCLLVYDACKGGRPISRSGSVLICLWRSGSKISWFVPK
jgi:hypothetical protein